MVSYVMTHVVNDKMHNAITQFLEKCGVSSMRQHSSVFPAGVGICEKMFFISSISHLPLCKITL